VKSRTTPQTGCALGVPSEEPVSSFAVLRHAAVPFALSRNPRKTCPARVKSRTTPQTGCALGVPSEELARSFPVWWHAAVPFALSMNPRKTCLAPVKIAHNATNQLVRAIGILAMPHYGGNNEL